MILDLNPEQFLLVYNHVSSNLSSPAQELKMKMESPLLEALSSIDDTKNQSRFSSWMKQEKEKVVHLENDLKNIKAHSPIVIPDDGLYFPIRESK